MSLVILERYLRAYILGDEARQKIMNIKIILDETDCDKSIKKQCRKLLKETLILNDLLNKRLYVIRKDYDEDLSDFNLTTDI